MYRRPPHYQPASLGRPHTIYFDIFEIADAYSHPPYALPPIAIFEITIASRAKAICAAELYPCNFISPLIIAAVSPSAQPMPGDGLFSEPRD